LTLLVAFVLGTTFIFSTRNSPPTVSEITYDLQRMPYIILFSEQPHPDRKINRQFIPFGIKAWQYYFESVDGSKPYAKSLDAGRIIFFNLSMLLPKFDRFAMIGDAGAHTQMKAQQKPWLELFYQQNSQGEIVDIMAASPDVPPEELIKNGTLYTKHLTLLGRQGLGCQQSDQCRRYNMGLQKKVLPKPGIFIGYPFEGHHTQIKYHAEFDMHLQHCFNEGTTFFIVTVVSETMTTVRPLSMLEQFQALLSRFGGYAALMCTTFFTIFVFKYPESEIEEVSHILTLPGFKKDKRPDLASLIDH